MKQPTDDLVYAVNEAFHDAEGAAYAGKHPEIFSEEAQRWSSIASRYLAPMAPPRTVLDFGCGTGFVTAILARELGPGDRLIACDLSDAMLKVTRELIESSTPRFAFQTLKSVPGSPLPIPDGSVDLIAMNSVLHHVPDSLSLLKALRRALRPGGAIVIGHEPNRAFFSGKGWNRYRLASVVWGTDRLMADLLGRLGLFDAALSLMSVFSAKTRRHRDTVDATNRELIRRGLIKRPLPARTMASILDIQSPSAGGYHPDRGLDVRSLAEQTGLTIDLLQTYNHLYTVSSRNRLTRALDRRLAASAPEEGATFTAVLRKPAESAQLREAV